MEEDQSRSRFLQQTMLPDEEIMMRVKFHWLYTFNACVKAGIWIVLGFAAAWLYSKYGAGAVAEAEKSKPVIFLPVVGIAIGTMVFLSTMVQKWTTEIVLTNRRFLYKTGVFSIITYKLNLHEINYCNVVQTLVGNWMNFGRVYMYTHTLDDKNIFLPTVARPHDFTKAIEALKRQLY